MSEGRQYVVVGGSKGIGLAIVRQLVEKGHHVRVLSRTWNACDDLSHVEHFPCDVRETPLQDEWLPLALHGLVFCPGSVQLRSFKTLKMETFREDLELNLLAAIRILQWAYPALKAGGRNQVEGATSSPASVVVFSSIAATLGLFGHASVAASKAALEGLVRTLACEWAPDVRVNCIAPALTQTSLTERFFADAEKARVLAEKYPLGRTGLPQDIANLATFLLNPTSSWMTGQVLSVDGGMSTLLK